MKSVLSALMVVGLAGVAVAEDKKPGDAKVPPLSFTMKGLDGKDVDLSQYKGKVVLFVNVASQCGLTPQYKGLEKLYEKYSDKGLVVIGVPANQFGSQEPGTDAEISTFCTSKYGVTFPMLSKVVVKGDGICPLYDFLTRKEANPKLNGEIIWNFEKFLVGRNGEVVNRFPPRTTPEDPKVTKAIEEELAKK
ncbi:MAG: glutathione peroxidase [Gemmataceae bacterium]